jgi:hypothetical protein
MKPSQDLLQLDLTIAYPPTRDRPNPSDDGSDLLGRHFLEPELGVCYITGLGPILHKVISTRAERNQQSLPESEPTLPTGAHYTLFYRQKLTNAEHVSSITEILHWIKIGPILQPPPTATSDSIHGIPTLSQATDDIPAANTRQIETTQQDVTQGTDIPTKPTTPPVPDTNEILAQIANEDSIPIADTPISENSSIEATRTSTRTRTKRDFLQPKFHGKVYNVREKSSHTPGKQRVFTQNKTTSIDPNLNGDWYLRPMPTSSLPPVFRKGPLNLNSDGTKINYKKSHAGP